MRRVALLSLAVLGFLCAQSCSEENQNPPSLNNPRIRVLVLENAAVASLSSNSPVQIWEDASSSARVMRLTGTARLSRSGAGWQLNSVPMGGGVLTIQAAGDGLRVNGVAYHGFFRFLPVGAGSFSAVNDVDIDQYIQGVVACEMYHDWSAEAYRAQAVASRTYALFEAKTSGVGREWDVYADQRSQMYGAISGETAQSRYAAQSTAGVVLTYGPGDGKIFKAYFSSCCGGVAQAAADAFPGEAFLPPLAEQYRGTCCNASKYFNWGPITIKKSELTRRVRLWGTRMGENTGKSVPESEMGEILKMEVQASNRYGRPTRVLITDARGVQYSLAAEDMRAAVNTEAAFGSTLPSSFCRINGDPNLDSVTFFDGHGFGHGVGMCQWCAEARAQAGQSAEQILLASYPGAKLIRAY
jgi:stage II sporulation protein D